MTQPRRRARVERIQRGVLLTLPNPVPNLNPMEVTLTPDQEAFVRQAIASGRFGRAEDAVREALALWEERERKRVELLAAIDEAEASLARDEGRVFTGDSARELVSAVKKSGRARLQSEKNR